MNSSKKSSNKITEIVRLQQILKKWKKLAINGHQKNTRSNSCSNLANGPPTTAKSNINKFLKKTLSFSESSLSSPSSSSDVRVAVPKGYLAVCVGEELKKFVIPMEYLGHQAFALLLREAEEEFGFQQEGILKIPCQVPVFENILKTMESDNCKRADAFGDGEISESDIINIHATSTTSTSAAATNSLAHCYAHHSPPPDCEHAGHHHHHHRHQPQPPQMCR